jgi:hypothetical protein
MAGAVLFRYRRPSNWAAGTRDEPAVPGYRRGRRPHDSPLAGQEQRGSSASDTTSNVSDAGSSSVSNATSSASYSSGNGDSSGSVTGTVTWPDGQPAVNVSVYFNNHETGFSGSGWSQHDSANSWYQVRQLPADGSYSLPGCPCGDLTAYLLVPSSVMSAANGGWDCWIIMQDGKQNYSGRQANPGDVSNWQALDMPCSPTFYTSDQPTVQSETSTVLPSLNSGSWQTAEQVTGG